ncbi:MAG: hypothetical protein AAF982_01985 [Pseudomonadota bacterium]
MADYDFVADSELDPGSPMNTSLFTRLARNPEAIAEGSAGAPRIQVEALEELTAGDVVRYAYSGPTVASNGTLWRTFVGFYFVQQGTIRLKIEFRSSNSTNRDTRILVDGVEVWTHEALGTDWEIVSADIPISRGASIELQYKGDSGVGFHETRLLEICTGGEIIFPMVSDADVSLAIDPIIPKMIEWNLL